MALYKGLRDDLRHTPKGYLLVEDLLGQDDHHWPALAEAMAACSHHIRFPSKALLPNLLDEGQSIPFASPGPTPCPATDRHTGLVRISLLEDGLSQRNQILIGSQLQLLSLLQYCFSTCSTFAGVSLP